MPKHKRIKSNKIKGKLDPIPHNNRGHLKGRMAYTQIITMKDPDPNKQGKTNLGQPFMIKKTIIHMNLSAYEQRRIHMIKTAIADGDADVLKKLNPRERQLYDNLLKEKHKREGGEFDANGDRNNG